MVDAKSLVGVKSGYSGVIIGYKFSCMSLAEHFIAQSHIYAGFMGKMSTLTHFLFETGCEDYSFWS